MVFFYCSQPITRKVQWINPTLSINSELVKIVPSVQQPNRVLIHKPPSLRFVIPHQVVMQPGFFIIILVLQSKRLMHILVNPLVLFQTIQGGVFSVPQKIAMDVGHLFRYADLIVVEVVRLLSVFSVFVDVVLIGETAYVPHVPYVRNEGFVWATACLGYFTVDN